MKKSQKRGIRIQNRIIISALLLLLQLTFLFFLIYDSSFYSVWGFSLSNLIGAVTAITIINKRGNPDHKIVWIIFILILRLLLDELVSNECSLDYFISCFSSLNKQDDQRLYYHNFQSFILQACIIIDFRKQRVLFFETLR